MANFTQQDGIQMQQQVATLMTQMQALMDQNANITATFDQFRAMATQEIHNLKATGTGASGETGMKLMSAKDFKPTNFSGLKDQDYKPWRKKFLTYVNLQCAGFRAALEWVEKRGGDIDAQATRELNWNNAAEADPKFWDFLSMTTSDNAQIIVESVEKGRGFEAWRLLHERFAPSGGRFELSKMVNVFKRSQCKNIDELPRAVDDLEKDVKKYNDVTGFKFPEELKLPLLLECLPTSHKSELEMKYTMGQRDYSKVVKDLLTYAKEQRFTHKKDPNAMDLDSLEKNIRDIDNARREYENDAARAQEGQMEYSQEEWIDYM